jgi:hypothetical protein
LSKVFPREFALLDQSLEYVRNLIGDIDSSRDDLAVLFANGAKLVLQIGAWG